MITKRSGKLSVILLSYFSGNKLELVRDKLASSLGDEGIPYELLIIDDGSTDGTFVLAEDLELRYPEIRSYQLSRNYTSNYSIFAGLELAEGSCAVAIPDDDQQPYNTLVKMYRMWQNGHQVMIPHRLTREDGFVSDFLAKSFYMLINKLSDITYPVGGADTFLVDREVINILTNRIHHTNTAVIPEILRLGFNPQFVGYHRPRGNNDKSRWTFKKKKRLFEDIFYSSSSFPIKLIKRMGLFLSLLAISLVTLYVGMKIFGDPQTLGLNIQGWTSLFVIITFFSGMILFSLGIIAEYVWRVYEEVKGRPGYLIKGKTIK